MMKSSFPSVFPVVVVVLAILSFGCPESYSEEKPALKCFMKDFQDVPQESLKIGEKASGGTGLMTKEALKELAEAGQTFFEANQKKFERLYGNFASVMSDVPKPLPQSKITKLEDKSPGIDFRFCRDIARNFNVVAYFHFSRGDFVKAVKTLFLVYSFGQHVGCSDVTLVHQMISVALKKIALSDLLWDSIAQGKFKAETLDGLQKQFTAVKESTPAFQDTLKGELATTLREAERGLLSPDSIVEEASSENGRQLVKKIVERLQEANGAVFKIISANLNNPNRMNEEFQKFCQDRKKSLSPNVSDIADPVEKSVQTLLAISLPDFPKSYRMFLQGKCLEDGVLLLLAYLARREAGKPFPATLVEFEAVSGKKIPTDYFSPQLQPCKLLVKDSALTVYSVGTDGHDDGGDQEKDVVLFKLRKN